MLNMNQLLSRFRRPKTLMRAANHGATGYRRDKHLKKILKSERLPSAEKIVTTLLREEALLETARKDIDIPYSLHRHIRVLAALVGELRAAQAQ